MYGIALSVRSCLRGGTRVDVAWSLDPGLTSRFDATDAVGITPGGGRLGGLLGGAVDSRLVEVAAAKPSTGRIVHIDLNPIEAQAAGVEAGTALRVFMAPADTLPAEIWDRLVDREPVALRVDLDGDVATGATMVDDAPPRSSVELDDTSVTTAWAPRTTLLVMGGGPMAGPIASAGGFAGWQVEAMPGPEAAVGLAATLSPIDGVVVVGHDIEGTGRVLQAALGSRAGYIGSVGPPDIQTSRLDWLAYRGITDLERLHAPAGLDIGASSPPQVAIAVVAEMLGALNS